jgi:crotonobetaine/carnitine-CoA ligase
LRQVLTMGLEPRAWPAVEERFGARVACGYGLTEAGMLCTLATDRPGASGRANARYELAVVDDGDRPLAPGSVGQVVCRPRRPNEVMIGYHRMPEATAEAFRNGWLHTGDLGWFDPDGYFHFADRRKDMIKRRGENVSATEVETNLARHPTVADVAVVPYAATGDEEVRAFVVAQPSQAVDPGALVRWLGERVAHFMVPRYVDVVAELPRNALGKVEKFKLRARPLASGTFDRVAAGVKVER